MSGRSQEEPQREWSEEDPIVETVERELTLPASSREVWEVVTGSGWLADEVEFELVPGGDACFTTESETRTGWVEEARAPDDADGTGRLVFWWSAGAEPATRVDVSVEPDGVAATRVRVLEQRPLEILDLVGIPLPGTGGSALPGMGGSSRGPVMLSLA